MKVTQYPHALYARVKAESTKNELGHWITDNEPQYKFVGTGRLELAGEGNEEKTTDGKHMLRNGVFYSQICNDIARGEQVIISSEIIAQSQDLLKITDIGGVLLSGFVKSSDKTQLHTKIYVYDYN